MALDEGRLMNCLTMAQLAVLCNEWRHAHAVSIELVGRYSSTRLIIMQTRRRGLKELARKCEWL
jgi:hypothetical protein